jgi:hypothetical protein
VTSPRDLSSRYGALQRDQFCKGIYIYIYIHICTYVHTLSCNECGYLQSSRFFNTHGFKTRSLKEKIIFVNTKNSCGDKYGKYRTCSNGRNTALKFLFGKADYHAEIFNYLEKGSFFINKMC